MTFSKAFGTVVHVRIHTPTYKFKDVRLSNEIANSKQENEKTISAIVNIFGGHSKLLEAIVSCGKKARAISDEFVLGTFWDSKVISASAIGQHETAMREQQELFKALVNDFLSNLEKIKADAINESGGILSHRLFNERRFGSVEEVAERFAFQIQYTAIPEKNPFDDASGLDLKGLNENAVNDLVQKQNKQYDDEMSQLDESLRSAKYDKLAEVLGKFNKGCESSTGQVNSKTLYNLERHLIMHKAFNVDNDPKYTDLVKQIVNIVKPLSIEETKEDDVREHLKRETDPILDQLAIGYGG